MNATLRRATGFRWFERWLRWTRLGRMVCRTIVALLLAVPAAAHEWYPVNCCAGQDCARIPFTQVHQIGPTSYEITLFPGDVPTVTEATIGDGPDLFFFEGNPGFSPDGQAHVCVTKAGVIEREVRCLFIGGLS